MFMKLAISLAILVLCESTSCGFKNVNVDMTGNIAVTSSDGQQVLIETDNLGSFLEEGTIKVQSIGANGIPDTIEYNDERVSHHGQRESDILKQVFSQFIGQQDEVTFKTLKRTVLSLINDGKIKPIVLDALEQLSCQKTVTGNDITGVITKQQLQSLNVGNTIGNELAKTVLFGQIENPESVKTVAAQAAIQQILQEKAELAEILKRKVQQDVELQAQIANAILEKEVEVQAIAENVVAKSYGSMGTIGGSVQDDVIENQILQAKMQEALEDEAQLANYLQIKIQKDVQIIAQLAQALLEKEAVVQEITENEALRKIQQIGSTSWVAKEDYVKNLAGVNSDLRHSNVGVKQSPFGLSQNQAVLRNSFLGSSLHGSTEAQSIQQQLGGLRHLNVVDNTENIEEVSQQLRQQGVPFPTNIQVAKELVAQNTKNTILRSKKSPVVNLW